MDAVNEKRARGYNENVITHDHAAKKYISWLFGRHTYVVSGHVTDRRDDQREVDQQEQNFQWAGIVATLSHREPVTTVATNVAEGANDNYNIKELLEHTKSIFFRILKTTECS